MFLFIYQKKQFLALLASNMTFYSLLPSLSQASQITADYAI